jgi:Holliday junction resolvase RusA-like endonuclease
MTDNYFVVEMQLPSLNEYQNECRRNKYSGAKFKKQIEENIELFIWKYRRQGTLRPIETFPCALKVEWHEKDRRRDVDNIKSAMKFILDAMVHAGIIKDDGRRYINQIHDTIVEDCKQTFVVIKIIEPQATNVLVRTITAKGEKENG